MNPPDLFLDLVIAPGTSRTQLRISKARGVFVVGRWGDRQFAADRLDPQFLAMGVQEWPPLWL
jgi:hypothetical protein